jgi:hypothetical protein
VHSSVGAKRRTKGSDYGCNGMGQTCRKVFWGEEWVLLQVMLWVAQEYLQRTKALK